MMRLIGHRGSIRVQKDKQIEMHEALQIKHDNKALTWCNEPLCFRGSQSEYNLSFSDFPTDGFVKD